MIDTFTLNPSIDQYLLVPHWVKDDTLRAVVGHRYPGGKGINVARALKVLGRSTRAFTLVGGMAGYMLRDLLANLKIDCVFVEIPGETRINMIVTDTSDRTQTRLSLPGPEIDSVHRDLLVDLILKARPQPEFWVMGGSVPPGIGQDIYFRIVQKLSARGPKCVLDTDEEALREGIRAKPFMIKPNEFELERLVGRTLGDEREFLEAARDVCRQGVEVVALTLGVKGALVVTREESWQVTAPLVEVKSKVGAGDCFIAGFLDALESGGSLEQAGMNGVAAGTAAVIHEGTAFFTREDFERLKPQVKTRRLS